jgi:CheY-like chemotaxis protein
VNRTILVVDDDRSCRLSLVRLLKTVRYDVLSAASAAEALQTATRSRPAVVVLDLQLSDGSGIEVARALRTLPALASTRFVALSGTLNVGDDVSLFEDVLTKPCRASDLIDAIEAAMHEARMASQRNA